MLDQEGAPTDRAMPGPVALGERLTTFKRLYRWLNLTLVQQAVWPLLILLTDAPADPIEGAPWDWYLVRLAAPLAAAALAVVYLRQRPLGTPRPEREVGRANGAVATQLRFAAIGLPVMVVTVRLLAGPFVEVLKLALFGLADVAAYHLIHFGVVVRSYPRPEQGRMAAMVLFGLSWAIRETMLVGAGAAGGSMAIAFAGGLVAGVIVAVASLALREWLGALPAAAAHWLIVYLVIGFAR